MHPAALMVQQKAVKVLCAVLHPSFGSHGNRWEGGRSMAGSICRSQGCCVKDISEQSARCPRNRCLEHPHSVESRAPCLAPPGAPAVSTGSLLPSSISLQRGSGGWERQLRLSQMLIAALPRPISYCSNGGVTKSL